MATNVDFPPGRVKQAFSAGASLVVASTGAGLVASVTAGLPTPFVWFALAGELLIMGAGATWLYRRLVGVIR